MCIFFCIQADNATDDLSTIDQDVAAGKPINVGQLKVLQDIQMPAELRSFLNNLVINAPKTTKNSDGSQVTAGQVTYDNLPLDVQLRSQPKIGGGSDMAIIVGFPAGFKLSAVTSKLSALDVLSLTRSALIYSTVNYTDAQWKIDVQQGVNLYAAIQIAGIVESLTKPIGKGLNEIDIQGLITPTYIGSYFKATLPGVIKIGKIAQTTGISFVVRYLSGSFSVGLEAGFSVNFPNQPQPIAFQGSVSVKNTEIIVNMWMDNYIQNAFGINGLQFGKVTYLIGSDIAEVIESEGLIPISSLGIGGSIKVGTKEYTADALVDLSETSPSFVLLVDFPQGLSVADIATFGVELANAVQPLSNKDQIMAAITKSVPPIGLQKAQIYVVPKDTVLSGKNYAQGISADGQLQILGTQAQMVLKIDAKQILGSSSIKTKIGPVTITGVGPDQKAGTPDDAAIVSIAVDPVKGTFAMFIDGTVIVDPIGSFEGLKGDTKFTISATDLSGSFMFNLLNTFSAQISLGAKQPASAAGGKAAAAVNAWSDITTWSLGVDFTQQGLASLGKLLSDVSGAISAKAKTSLSQAAQSAQSITDGSAAIDAQIADLNTQINARVQQNLKAIAKAQDTVNSLKATKDKLDAQVAICKGKQPKLASDVDQYVQGPALTPDQIQDAVNQMKTDNPDMPQEAIDAALQTLSTQYDAGQLK